jgi:hypothetical protein
MSYQTTHFNRFRKPELSFSKVEAFESSRCRPRKIFNYCFHPLSHVVFNFVAKLAKIQMIF